MTTDVRWMQRFNNYLRALRQVEKGVAQASQRTLNDLEKQGLIQGFEYTHELAWNMMKDYLTDQGFTDLVGSKDTARQAFKSGLITDGEIWMDMIKNRNLTSHTYDESVAEEIFTSIVHLFFPAFKKLADTFTKLHDREKE